MKHPVSIIFLAFFVLPSFGQSKVTPASRSELSEIELPAGSKQDKRILATASAKTLLDMIAEDNQLILEEGVEVFTLIGVVGSGTVDQTKLGAQKAGWQLTPLMGQTTYWLLTKNAITLLMYLESSKRDTQLYLSAVKSKLPVQGDNPANSQVAALPIQEPATQPQQNSNTNTDSSILGTWVASASDQSSWRVNNGVMSTIWRQYTFSANGTYTFISKTFDPLMDKLLLGKESGTHQISGNTITLRPQKSVLEAWSKKDGTNKWGDFLTTQNIALEQTTYQFTKNYFEGNQKWNLVLQADKETKRDGPFSGNTTFTNSWYYGPVSPTNNTIELPGEQQTRPEAKTDPIQSTPVAKGKFTFTNITFDDGWVSTVREDWVEVTKSNVKVLIHYPNATTSKYISNPDEERQISWNTLVAPRYTNLQNYFVAKNSVSYFQSSFVSGTLTDKQTGQSVYVALFKRDHGPWLEFIAPNINAFGQVIGFDISKLNDYVSSSDWDPLLKLEYYNRFAVAASDLTGTWTNNFGGFTQYVNAYTGTDAGMNTHSSTQTFEFLADGTYNWSIGVASGFVGSIKFSSAKSSGKFTNPNNWQIHFSDLEGKPKLYNAYFACVKGARILWLQDTSYGGYSSYGRQE